MFEGALRGCIWASEDAKGALEGMFEGVLRAHLRVC